MEWLNESDCFHTVRLWEHLNTFALGKASLFAAYGTFQQQGNSKCFTLNKKGIKQNTKATQELKRI